ncbi:hypothetical protein OAQ99_03890 [Candidatus Kapabacteria bacterium]|nr:hypothetical protein [Candidatus Kapabacteria bacterium]
MSTNTLIAYPKSHEQEIALRSFMQSQNIEFEEEDSKEYEPEFVAKILESEAEVKAGKTVRVDPDNFKSFLGL